MRGKRGQIWEGELPSWIIVIAVLVIIVIFSFLLRDKLAILASSIKNIFR